MLLLFIFIVGLALGSFTNAYVWRLYKQTKTSSKKQLKDLSIVKGRSMCPDCKHQLRAADLIPVLSWISLKGKCRYCNKPISAQYPVVELATGLLLVFSYVLWPHGWSFYGTTAFALWLIVVVMANTLFMYDLKWMILPDRVVKPFTLVVLAYVLLTTLIIPGEPEGLLWALAGAALLFGGFYFLFQLSSGKWIGGGDVKLGVALGLLAGGPLEAMLLLFVASFVGTLISIPLLLRAKQKAQIKLPFGPLLIAAAYLVHFFAGDLVDIYFSMIGIY